MTSAGDHGEMRTGANHPSTPGVREDRGAGDRLADEAAAGAPLGCVVCGDDGEFLAVAEHALEAEVMCSRCGQARLVPILGAVQRRIA